MKKKFTMFIVSALLVGTTAGESIFASTNGKVNQITVQTKEVKGVQMVPLRKVSEKLGFNVIWDGKEKSAKLDDGMMNTIVTVGRDSYYASSSTAIGMTAPQSLGIGPLLIEGTMYVPADMFWALLGNNENAVVVSNGTATITKSY